MLKGKDGLEVSRITATPVVGEFPKIPQVGDKAPVIHTPTAADVGGDLAKIDTRVPPDQMHQVDFADAVGKKPIVLVFATPGPLPEPGLRPGRRRRPAGGRRLRRRSRLHPHGDLEATTKSSKGPRPQVQAYHLETEPWTFLIDSNGIVRDRIEGAFGVSELEEAMRTIVPG